MTGIPVFFCVPTGDAVWTAHWNCACGGAVHEATPRGPLSARPPFPTGARPCPACGKQIDGPWSQSQGEIFTRADTGAEVGGLDPLPAGACRAADPSYGYRTGPDGRSLWVMLPDGGEWCIDSRANNCTRPEDHVHRCWVRTGRPEDGTLDVGKSGDTCSAGAGSIATPKWHGFLRNGHLVAC